MDMLCPECRATLESNDGQWARCPTHGGEYQILFSHWQPPGTAAAGHSRTPGEAPLTMASEPALEGAPPPPIPTCYQHPTVGAVYACQGCGALLCPACGFQDSAGTFFCQKCLSQRSAPGQPLPYAPPGVRCVQHTSVEASRQCKMCGAFMCQTCDFAMPGGIHICPACAISPRTRFSSRRRNLMIGSYALAVFATLGFVPVITGIYANLMTNKAEERAFDLLFSLTALLPALIGMSLGLSATDRRLTNPLRLWIATGWNMLLVGVYLLLSIIAAFMGS